MIKKTFALTCALGLVLCLPRPSLGCECDGRNAAEAFAAADAVFVGKVVKTAPAKEARVGMSNDSWNKYVIEAQSATLEVGETFKGVTGGRVKVVSGVKSPKSCGVGFEEGESYLVYAVRRRHLLREDAAGLPKESWTREMLLSAEADEQNAKLPPLATSTCLRTAESSARAEDLSEIRRIVKK